MRLRRSLAIGLLSTSGLGVIGCLGVAGDFVIDTDASVDDQYAPKPDGAAKPDGPTPGADADAGTGPSEDSGTSPDDGAPAATDTEPPDSAEDAGPCALTGPCDAGTAPGPCTSAVYICPEGGASISVCAMTALPNGTTCTGGAPNDAGAAEVCFDGGCNACNLGASCPAAQPCLKSLINCDTGQSACVDAGIQPDGFPCGTDGGAPMYCNAGACSACLQGSPCTTKAEPCNQATVTACPGGTATCTASAALVEAGTPCGTDLVCNSAGKCISCTANMMCIPPSAACHLGLTACTTGASVCTDTTVWAPDRTTSCDDGNPCTVGDICLAGKCHSGATNTCPATDQCHTGGGCSPTNGSCPNLSKTNGTSCNEDDNACTSDTCQSGVCKVGNEVSCNSPGPCFTETNSSCNKVTGQCSYTSVVCNPAVGCQKPLGCSTSSGKCEYAVGSCAAPTRCETGTGNCNGVDGGCTYPICTNQNQCQLGPGSCVSGACQYASRAQGYTPLGAACTCDGQGNCVVPTPDAGDTE